MGREERRVMNDQILRTRDEREGRGGGKEARIGRTALLFALLHAHSLLRASDPFGSVNYRFKEPPTQLTSDWIEEHRQKGQYQS